MAAIRLEGVTKTLAAGRREAHLAGRERGARAGVPTLPEDVPEGGVGGPVRALDGVDLEVRDGETLALLGPSGCGKSTLLRVVAGLEAPDEGRVLYDGEDVRGVPPGERGIGMVFQNYALYPHMESKGNLGFFLRLRRRQESEIDERVRVTAEIMGLGFEELLDRRPGTLSGGQQQRVAIGRCIARDPRLFLLDEPLSNLDARLRARTRVELKRLLARFRNTALYVTHDQTEAIALADRIAVMRRGRIEQVGTWETLYERPASAFVVGFVGTPGAPPANMLPGVVEGGRVRLPAGFLPMREGVLGEGVRVLVGLRPEGVTVVRAGAAEGSEAGEGAGSGASSGEGTAAEREGWGELVGTVEAVEPLIADRVQLVHVALEESRAGSGGEGAASAAPAFAAGAHGAGGVTVTVRAPLAPVLERGTPVVVRLDPQRALLFDAATELLLEV